MGSYSVERSITVEAPAHEVHALVDDFHRWTAGRRGRTSTPPSSAPTADRTRASARTTSGRATARPAQGRMEITRSDDPSGVVVALDVPQAVQVLDARPRSASRLAATAPVVDVADDGRAEGPDAAFGKVSRAWTG